MMCIQFVNSSPTSVFSLDRVSCTLEHFPLKSFTKTLPVTPPLWGLWQIVIKEKCKGLHSLTSLFL